MDDLIYLQPTKCKSCIWGRWQETKQYCSRPICVKENDVTLKRFCRKQGCNTLTDTGYCEAHTTVGQQYDQYRGTPAERGYTSRWAKYSRLYRKKHPLCVDCLKDGRIVASQHTDHIIAVSGPNDPLFYSESNHQALCAPCHSRKTVLEDGGFGNG